jgi:Ca-activated chloride channel homolog
MRRLGVVVSALVVALAHPAAQGPTFRAETELVSFAVTVTDRRGNFLTELEPEHFEIVEDGRAQTLRYFARGDVTEQGPDLHLGLLLDTSGSMSSDIQVARTAAIRFLNTLSDAKDMTLVEFDTEVRVSTFGQQDFPRLVERIRSRDPRGWTAMYDAVGVYLDGAVGNEGRTILMLFTDGGDTKSVLRFNDLMTLVRASDATIYAIGFLENQPSRVRDEQRLRLRQLATETGGEAFFPRSMAQIEEAYDRIVEQIRSQFILGYVSTNTRTDGTWRRVDIRVRHPGSGNLRVHARRGYFALNRDAPP